MSWTIKKATIPTKDYVGKTEETRCVRLANTSPPLQCDKEDGLLCVDELLQLFHVEITPVYTSAYIISAYSFVLVLVVAASAYVYVPFVCVVVVVVIVCVICVLLPADIH